MATASKLLSDSWRQSRMAALLQSLKNLKPLQHLSADDIMSIVRTAEFHAFNIGDLICQQASARILARNSVWMIVFTLRL
jgi:hypothetical protein